MIRDFKSPSKNYTFWIPCVPTHPKHRCLWGVIRIILSTLLVVVLITRRGINIITSWIVGERECACKIRSTYNIYSVQKHGNVTKPACSFDTSTYLSPLVSSSLLPPDQSHVTITMVPLSHWGCVLKRWWPGCFSKATIQPHSSPSQ